MNLPGAKGIEYWGTTQEFKGKSFYVNFELSPYNRRITILDYQLLGEKGTSEFISLLDSLCKKNELGKVWGKFRQEDVGLLSTYGFTQEATILNYYGYKNDALVCSKFYDDRHVSTSTVETKRMLQKVGRKINRNKVHSQMPPGFFFKFAEPKDIPVLAELYREVFKSYPYPVFNKDYLTSTLDHVLYGLVYQENDLVAAASAEINFFLSNSEMTDFATTTSARGKGLALIILAKLENKLAEMGINCLYTIARSSSLSMNLVFSRSGYHNTGTLVNNCHIAGGFEDMNVWCKSNY